MRHETRSNGILETLKEPPTHFLSLSEASKCPFCFADCLQAFDSAEVLDRPKSTGSSGYILCPQTNAPFKSSGFQKLGAREICSLKGLATPSHCLVSKNCQLWTLPIQMAKHAPRAVCGCKTLQLDSLCSFIWQEESCQNQWSYNSIKHVQRLSVGKEVGLAKKTMQGIANMSKT